MRQTSVKNNAPFPHHGPITNWPKTAHYELKVISRILDDNPQTLERGNPDSTRSL